MGTADLWDRHSPCGVVAIIAAVVTGMWSSGAAPDLREGYAAHDNKRDVRLWFEVLQDPSRWYRISRQKHLLFYRLNSSLQVKSTLFFFTCQTLGG